MNKDAEAEIERLAPLCDEACNHREDGAMPAKYWLRKAMAWAYQDAARVCREAADGTTVTLVGAAFAEAIEARAKA